MSMKVEHEESKSRPGICHGCREDWPCETVRLRDEVEALRTASRQPGPRPMSILESHMIPASMLLWTCTNCSRDRLACRCILP